MKREDKIKEIHDLANKQVELGDCVRVTVDNVNYDYYPMYKDWDVHGIQCSSSEASVGIKTEKIPDNIIDAMLEHLKK